MMFIYLLEGHPEFAPKVQTVLAQSRRRGDILLTSYLSLAESLVGMPGGSRHGQIVRETILQMGFTFVAFDQHAVEPFRILRADFRLKQPDAMHLACAAAVKTDLFLTNDTQLLKPGLQVPGVHFIANFMSAPL
jgi:hypothetical protein